MKLHSPAHHLLPTVQPCSQQANQSVAQGLGTPVFRFALFALSSQFNLLSSPEQVSLTNRSFHLEPKPWP